MERHLHLVNVTCSNKYCATATHATKLRVPQDLFKLVHCTNAIALAKEATKRQAVFYEDPLTVAAGIVGMSTAKQPTSYRSKPSQTG